MIVFPGTPAWLRVSMGLCCHQGGEAYRTVIQAGLHGVQLAPGVLGAPPEVTSQEWPLVTQEEGATEQCDPQRSTGSEVFCLWRFILFCFTFEECFVELDMVSNACITRHWENKAGSPGVRGQTGRTVGSRPA